MRINKYIATSGVCSRRKADDLIQAGQVKVNGEVLKEAGYQVVDGDIVSVSGNVIQPIKKYTYILLNKPKGVITSAKDDKGRTTVIDLLSENPDITDKARRLFPVGRLDFDTSGILLLTDDGDLTFKLTHPKQRFSPKEVNLKVSSSARIFNQKIKRFLGNIEAHEG